ncbi:MAG: class I SAM-dependent methyltransferase [Firmicutes bacterium]|nr:class I SAM-dependent methyltransferase [Bacillota bacterium]
MKKNDAKFVPALKYKRLTSSYDQFMKIIMPEEKIKNQLLDQAGIRLNDVVLDFGCGTATLTIMAKQRESLAEVFGLDIDKGVLQIAGQKVQKASLEIHLDSYDGNRFPYPDQMFDKVLSSLVFHHLTPGQKINALKEVQRVLKPGGELHVLDIGRPKNVFMRGVVFISQMLEGFATTSDSVRGMLPIYMRNIGLKEVEETSQINAVFGTLSVYKAVKA